MLTIFEELLLLSIHENKGTFIRSSIERIKLGLVGAVIAELGLMGKIQDSNNHRLHLADDSQTGDDILNEAIATLKAADKDRKFGYWINNLISKPEKLRKQITERLIGKEVLTLEDEIMVWVVPSSLQPDVSASTKYWVNERLRGIVLAQKESQPHDIALLSLIKACELLDLIFLRDERKLAARYINELVVSQAMKDPTIQTIQEIETAIAAVVEED